MSFINTIRETEEYRYDSDKYYGVGWFVRKRDDMVSLMDTGTDRDILILTFDPMTDEEFNEVAETRTYNSRWSEEG